MSRDRDSRDDDRAALDAAMKGVRPLAKRNVVRPSPPKATPPGGAADTEPATFEIEQTGERVEGRAPGIDRAHLRRLRSGGVRVESRVDLHGLRATDARKAVRAALTRAAEEGQRCVLVIHGRGHRSPSGPVLRDALPGWLAEPPLGARVMAFASAAPADGGSGATYVLLRRRVVRNSG